MSFEIKKATRTGVRPLIGVFGKSGSGKTMSALLVARGLVGPKGRIVFVDSENGRGSLFADIEAIGGYNVIDIDAPFSPARYEEAIVTAEANADVVVVDSLTHEHNGEGGVLDMQEAELERMAGSDWKKREACKMAAWIKPKIEHKKFIARLLRLKCALICCLRGEEKTHIDKGDDGKNRVITDKFSTPIFDQRFIFEMLVSLEMISQEGKGGYVVPLKITHPDVGALLPKPGQQIGIAHGQALARWCDSTGGSAPAQTPSTPPVTTSKTLKGAFWTWCKKVYGNAVTPEAALAQLREDKILTEDQTLETLDAADLQGAIDKLEIFYDERKTV